MFTLQLHPFDQKDGQFHPFPDLKSDRIAEMVQFLDPKTISITSDGNVQVEFSSSNSPEEVNSEILTRFRSCFSTIDLPIQQIWLKPVCLEFQKSSRKLELTSLTVQSPDWLVFQTGHTRRLAIQRIFERLHDAISRRCYGIGSSVRLACVWDRNENRIFDPAVTDAQFFELKDSLQRDGVVVFAGASVRDITGLLRILRDLRFARDCYLENLREIGIQETGVGKVCWLHIPTQ